MKQSPKHTLVLQPRVARNTSVFLWHCESPSATGWLTSGRRGPPCAEWAEWRCCRTADICGVDSHPAGPRQHRLWLALVSDKAATHHQNQLCSGTEPLTLQNQRLLHETEQFLSFKSNFVFRLNWKYFTKLYRGLDYLINYSDWVIWINYSY